VRGYVVYRSRDRVLLVVGQSVCSLPAQDLLEMEMSAAYAVDWERVH